VWPISVARKAAFIEIDDVAFSVFLDPMTQFLQEYYSLIETTFSVGGRFF
jgi:hypothetical protein